MKKRTASCRYPTRSAATKTRRFIPLMLLPDALAKVLVVLFITCLAAPTRSTIGTRIERPRGVPPRDEEHPGKLELGFKVFEGIARAKSPLMNAAELSTYSGMAVFVIQPSEYLLQSAMTINSVTRCQSVGVLTEWWTEYIG